MIDDPEPIDVRLLKRKSASLHWELMFTRALYGTPDMVAQHHLLNDLAALVDQGVLQTTGPGGHPKCPTYGHPNCSTLATVI